MDGVMAASADPTRRVILERPARGPALLSDVAKHFSMLLNDLSK
jgi:hypothetical protein